MYGASSFADNASEIDDDVDRHMPLKIFMYMFSIISVGVALLLSAAYESSYLSAINGGVLATFAGWGSYTLIFVVFAYFILYILHKVLIYFSIL